MSTAEGSRNWTGQTHETANYPSQTKRVKEYFTARGLYSKKSCNIGHVWDGVNFNSILKQN